MIKLTNHQFHLQIDWIELQWHVNFDLSVIISSDNDRKMNFTNETEIVRGCW